MWTSFQLPTVGAPSPLSRRTILGRAAALGLGLATAGLLGPIESAAAGPRTIACWGDSLTRGLGSGEPKTLSYPARLAFYAQRSVYNGGRPGERSGGIAARQEGRPARTSGQEVTIPSAGFVDIVLADEVFFRREDPVVGKFKGVEGTLTRVGDIGTTHRFTRTVPGSERVVPAGTPFHAADGLANRGADTIIWAGHNDDYVRDRPPPYPTVSIEDNIAAMVAYTEFSGNPPNYLVLSLVNGRDAGIGTVYYNRSILEVNVALEDTYGPDHYLDVHRYLVDQALADAGITPSDQDLRDIKKDITPTSLRDEQSAGHLNATGYDVLAKHIYDVYVSQRW